MMLGQVNRRRCQAEDASSQARLTLPATSLFGQREVKVCVISTLTISLGSESHGCREAVSLFGEFTAKGLPDPPRPNSPYIRSHLF